MTNTRPGKAPPRGFTSTPLRNTPSCLVSMSDQDVPINAGGAQFGSTSFTFFVRRIFAALVFGAQLCSARAASEDVIKDAHTKSGSDQATVRMMSWPARFNATPRIGDAKDIVAVKIFVRNKEPFVMAIYNDPSKRH
jgi:hypothetical protein